MGTRQRVAAMATMLVMAGWAATATAQPVGTFRWQQLPYCNVLTFNVVQAGAVFHLDGWDDQCGAPRQAAASGLAFLSPDGSIGMGITVVTTPGATPLHLDAAVAVANVSGTWRDSAGNSGTLAFTPGPAAGGSARPAPRTSFPAGLSVGNATIANLATPVAGSDAANRTFVETYAKSLATAPGFIPAYEGIIALGSIFPLAGGCVELGTGALSAMYLGLRVPVGAVLTGYRVRTVDVGATQRIAVSLAAVDFPEGGPLGGSAIDQFSSTPGTHIVTRTIAASATPSTRSYSLTVQAPAHSGQLDFCGVQPIFTIP